MIRMKARKHVEMGVLAEAVRSEKPGVASSILALGTFSNARPVRDWAFALASEALPESLCEIRHMLEVPGSPGEAAYAAIAASTVYREALREADPPIHSWMVPYGWLDGADLYRTVSVMTSPPGGTVVDLGCGLGGGSLWFLSFADSKLVGIDLSPAAIEGARALASSAGHAGDTRFYVAAAESTGLPDASADDAVSFDALSADKDLRTQMASIPLEKRFLVTSHDAFQYFARAYLATEEELLEGNWHPRFSAPEGLSPECELSSIDIYRIISHLKEYRIRILFTESNVNQDSIKKILEAGKKKGLRLSIASRPLYSDAMGTPGTPEGSYLGMMRYNGQVISHALHPGDS